MKLVGIIKMRLNENYSKVYVGKHLSDTSPIENDLKQGHALSSLLFQLFFRIRLYEGPRKIGWTEIEWGISASGLKKNTEALSDASKDIGLEVNIEKSK